MRNNPIRLRSKIYLLIYPGIISSIELKAFLIEVFKLKSDFEWKYVIKNESYSNIDHKILVFIELQTNSDIYSTKLDYPLNNVFIKGDYWTLSDRHLGLLYLFKQNKPLNDLPYISNLPETELEKYLQCMFLPDKTESKSNITESKSKQRKILTVKQEKKIQYYINEFNKERQSEVPNMQLLSKYVTNMRNYRYTHVLPEEIKSLIKQCEAQLSALSKGKD